MNADPRPPQPTELTAEFAQNICDTQENLNARVSSLEQTLRQHFKGLRMDKSDPARYEYLVARGVENALGAPIVGAVEADLIEHVLPSIQNHVPLAPSEVLDADFDRFFTIPYEGQGLWFMRASNAWAAGAAERFIRQMEGDEAHWCRPIWKSFCARHAQFAYWENQAEGARRSCSPYLEIISNSVDSNATAWSVLGPALNHLLKHRGVPISEVRGRLLAHAEELSWAASTNGVTPRQPNPSKCPFRTAPAEIAPRSLWRNPSLAQKPWRVRRYCPADIPLVLPDEHAQAATDALFTLVQRDSASNSRWHERPPGGGKAAEMRLVFGAYVLSELSAP